MQAAAKNLVPVTLELGGKSPVVIGRSAKLDLAGTCLTFGKLLNGDNYVYRQINTLVPNEFEELLIARVIDEAQAMYPNVTENSDYAGIFNEKPLLDYKAILMTPLQRVRSSQLSVLKILGRLQITPYASAHPAELN